MATYNTIISNVSGSVGIGTTNVTSRLTVLGNASLLSEPIATFRPGGLQTGGVGVLNAQDSSGNSLLFVSGSGNVGIGISVPAVRLDVAGAIRGTTFASDRFGLNANPLNTSSTSQSILRFQNTGGDFYVGIESSTGGAFFPGSTAYSAVLYNGASTPIHFYTGASLKATITSAGRLGLGLTDPSGLLANTNTTDGMASANSSGIQWKSTANDWAAVIISRPASGNNYGLRVHGGDGTTSSDYPFWVSSGATTGTARLVVRGDGNVGIGMTNPSSTLTVKTQTAAAFPALEVEDYADTTGMYFQSVSGGSWRVLGGNSYYYNSGNFRSDSTVGALINLHGGEVKFYTNSGLTANTDYVPSPRMTINSTGNVGIGTTSPEGDLDVRISGIGGTVQSAWSSAGMPYSTYGNLTITQRHSTAVGSGAADGFGYAGPFIDLRAANGAAEWSVSQIMGVGDPFGTGTYNGGLAFLVSGGGSNDPTGRRNAGDAPQVRMLIGASKMYISTNVGIGTTNPGSTLDVAGTLNVSTTITPITAVSTNGVLRFREFGSTAANNTIELHVRPSSGKSGYLTFTEDGVADRWSVGIANGNGNLRFISGTPTAGSLRVSLESAGNWIPAADNQQDLGSASLKWRTLFATNISGSLTPTGATAGSVFFAGVSGQIAQDNSNFFWDDANNRLGIGTASPGTLLDAYGTTNPRVRVSSGAATAPGFSILQSGQTGWTMYQPGSSSDLRFSQASDHVTFQNGGNVGIGTTNPRTKTHMWSTSTGANIELARYTSTYAAPGDGPLVRFTNVHPSGLVPNAGEYNLAGIRAYDYNSNWGGALQFLTAVSTGNGGALTAAMTISTTQDVGIGTATTAARVHVIGSSTAATPTMIVREGVASPTNGVLAFEVEKSTGATIFSVSGSGFVGVGTSNPAGTFEVVGISGSLLLVTDNLSGSLFSVNDVTGLPILEVFSDDTVVAGAVNTNALVVTGSRVGVGTRNPNGPLDVYGTATASPSNTAGIVRFNSTATNALIFGTLTGSPFASYIQSGGGNQYPLSLNPLGANVGIGVTNPTNTLDVNGTARIRSVSNATGNFATYSATGVLQQRTAAEVKTDLSLNNVQNLSVSQIFNNTGASHGTRNSFASITDFGYQYVTGTGDGPNLNSASQYYAWTIGLGSEYAYANYAAQFAIPRNVNNPYMGIRFREGGTGGTTGWGTWQKLAAGNADTLTTARTLWGLSFNGSADVSGNLTSVGNITGTGAVTLTASGAALSLVATGANVITATTNSTEALRITSGQNVGINTSTVSARLHVYGGGLRIGGDFATGGYPIQEFQTVRLNSNDRDYQLVSGGVNCQNLFMYGYLADRTTRASFNYAWYSGTGSDPTLQLTSGAAVGIGITNPSSKLHVAAGDIRFDSSYGIIGGTNTAGNVLRADGTRFVPAQLSYSDLSTTNMPTRTVSYSSITGASGDWFPIFKFGASNTTGAAICTLATAAHSTVTFAVNRGYPDSNLYSISVLNCVLNPNGGQPYVTELRVIADSTGTYDAQVEARLFWSSGPTVIVTATVMSSPMDIVFAASLATTAAGSASPGVSDQVTLSNNMMRAKGNFVTPASIGIGTTNPGYKLHVVDSGNTQAWVSSVSNSAGISIENQGQRNWQIWADRANDKLQIGNNSRAGVNVSISADSNVGIGTTAQDGYRLRIFSSGNAAGFDNQAVLAAKNSAGNFENFLWPRGSDNIMYMNYGSGGFWIRNNSSATTMFMTNDNRVGIGTTTSITSKLAIYDSSQDQIYIRGTSTVRAGIRIDNTAGYQSQILLADNGTDKWQFGKQTDNTFFVYDATATKNIIQGTYRDLNRSDIGLVPYQDGRVGIGTDPGTAGKLEIYATGSHQGIYQSDGTRWLRTMAGTVGDNSFNDIVEANDNAIIFSGSPSSPGTGALVIAPWASGTKGLRMDSSGNVGIGTTSMSRKLVVHASDALINGHTVGRGTDSAPSDNVALGSNANATVTSGQYNTAVGFYANRQNNALENTAVGYIAMDGNTASYNTAVGSQALYGVTSGPYNTAIGYKSLYSAGSSNYSVGVGAEAGYAGSSAGRTAVGYQALAAAAAAYTTAVGYRSLNANTTGTGNVGLGALTLEANDTGSNNTALGYNALLKLSKYSRNTAVGSQAMAGSTQGQDNVAVGYNSLYSSVTDVANVAMGSYALQACASSYNVGIGYSSLYSVTTGGFNVGIGPQAGTSITTGNGNVVIGGYGAGGSFATQANNIFLSDGNANLRMIITGSTGFVGIGTTQPNSSISVYNSTTNGTTAVEVQAPPYSGGSTSTAKFSLSIAGVEVGRMQARHGISALAETVVAAVGSGQALAFETNSVRAATIDTSQRVGIGTNNPATKLDVRGLTRIGSYGGTFQGLTLINNDDSSATENISFIDFQNNLGTADSHIFAGHVPGGSSFLAFGTTPAGSRSSDRRAEAMRITGDGKVGIGTLNPTATLSVACGSTEARINQVYTGYAGIFLNGSTTDDHYNILSNASGSDKNLYLNRPTGWDIRFRVNNNDQVTITSAGRVGIGTATPDLGFLHVNGVINNAILVFSYGWLRNATTASGRATPAFGENINSSIYASDRIISNTEVNSLSDCRAKDIERKIRVEEGLDFVEKVNPVIYTWKSSEKKEKKYGFIAQDVLKAGYDSLVGILHDPEIEEYTDEEGFTSPKGGRFVMCYDNVVPLLSAAMKGLKQENDSLKSEVQSLKDQISSILTMLSNK